MTEHKVIKMFKLRQESANKYLYDGVVANGTYKNKCYYLNEFVAIPDKSIVVNQLTGEVFYVH